MLHLNKKGFSVVELLVSFILVSIISMGMMTIVVQYQRNASLSNIKIDMVNSKNRIVRAVYTDLTDGNLKLSSVSSCGENCINFNYDSGTRNLSLRSENVNGINKNFIVYNDMRYNLADKSFVDGNLIFNQVDNTIYEIILHVSNFDIEGDYGFDLMAIVD